MNLANGTVSLISTHHVVTEVSLQASSSHAQDEETVR